MAAVRAPQDVRSRTLQVGLFLCSVAFAVLLLGPWGWQLNRLTVRLYVFFRTEVPIAPGWARPEDYGALLNVALFVPVGVTLALLTRWSWWWVGLIATLGSTLVELVQATVVGRDGSVLDVVTNGAGAVLGAVAVMGVCRWRTRR